MPRVRAAFARPGAALLVLIAAILLVGGGLAAWWETQPHKRGGATAAVDLGGPFAMVDQEGRPADQHLLIGKWSAVFFGYTFCPDVCPATLQALGQAAMKLTPDQRRTLQVVFVTVDPARDTAAQLKLYLDAQALPIKTIGLTGTPQQVAAIAKAYRVYYAKSGTGDNYAMDHSAAIYLMDPEGHLAAPLSPQMAPDLIARQIAEAEAARR